QQPHDALTRPGMEPDQRQTPEDRRGGEQVEQVAAARAPDADAERDDQAGAEVEQPQPAPVPQPPRDRRGAPGVPAPGYAGYPAGSRPYPGPPSRHQHQRGVHEQEAPVELGQVRPAPLAEVAADEVQREVAAAAP